MVGEILFNALAPSSAHRDISIVQAGAGGGLVASIATCPLDVIKTKLQAQRAIQGQRDYEGVFSEEHTSKRLWTSCSTSLI